MPPITTNPLMPEEIKPPVELVGYICEPSRLSNLWLVEWAEVIDGYYVTHFVYIQPISWMRFS